jgi:hypothetical protein
MQERTMADDTPQEDDDARYINHRFDPERWVNSQEARAKRAALSKQRITLRLDEDTVDQDPSTRDSKIG